jgi:GT2 family glycosyltransferase
MNDNLKSIPQTKVAIITVTYNSADFIEQYLDSVAPFLKGSEHQLILVDNESKDNTLEIIEQFAQKHHLDQQIQSIGLEKNLGFGKGCNKGVEAAEAYNPDYLWFLNPDTKVFDNSGKELLALLSGSEDVDFAGSVLVNEQSIKRPGAFRFPTLINVFLSNMRLGVLDKLFPKYTTAVPIEEKPYQADWLTGASFMVKSNCFAQLKGFDPYYFLYFEEVDLFYRAKKAGFSVWACPSSQVFHISGASTGINNRQSKPRRQPDYWFESRRYFYTSNFGTGYFMLVDTVFLISHLFWKLRSKLQRKPDSAIPYLARDTIKHSAFNILGNNRKTKS